MKFIMIEEDNAEKSIVCAIKNDYEEQLDCDYPQVFKEEREGETPFRYVVTVTVKKLGKLLVTPQEVSE